MKIVTPVADRANNGSQNKNIGDNGSGPATHSDYSVDRLTEEISGILSF
jgi:hypothetical protein